MDYTKCTNNELHKFAIDRKRITVDVYRPHLPSEMYISLLQAADQGAQFDFLRLPAELRNETYGHIFAPKFEAPPSTNLLRTCRQIKDETSGFPIHNFVLDIVLEPTVCGLAIASVGNRVFSDEERLAQRLPEQLRDARFVTITLDLSEDFYVDNIEHSDVFGDFNFVLTEMAGMAASVEDVKICIDCAYEEMKDLLDWSVVLEPVTDCPKLRVLDINGVNEQTSQHLQERLASS